MPTTSRSAHRHAARGGGHPPLNPACPPVVPPPPGWTCDAAFFGDSSCDCGCGAEDIDCPGAALADCEFCNTPDDGGGCSSGIDASDCPANINPANVGQCT